MTNELLIKLAQEFEQLCQTLVKTAFIKKLPNGKYRVMSESGKNMGTFTSKDQAKKRLKQIEYFKHLDANDVKDSIDLTNLEEVSYSAIMRELNKKTTEHHVFEFMKIFKAEFDKNYKKKAKNPEKDALKVCLLKFNKKYKIKLDPDMLKKASLAYGEENNYILEVFS